MSRRIISLHDMAVSVTVFSSAKYRQPEGDTVTSAWFVGVLVLMVYLIFAMTLYLLPPRVS